MNEMKTEGSSKTDRENFKKQNKSVKGKLKKQLHRKAYEEEKLKVNVEKIKRYFQERSQKEKNTV